MPLNQSPSFRSDAFIALSLITIALFWDALGWDMALARRYGSANGFVLKNNEILELWFHDVAQNAARFLILFCVIMIYFPFSLFKQLSKNDRVHLVLASILAALAVVLVKQMSLSSCPWSLSDFGGVAHYVGHWQWGVRDLGGGRCFPGGHSSSGFAFIAGALWFRSASKKIVFWMLLSASMTGLTLGWVQQIRGAHFLSHTLWAWVICTLIGLMYYHTVLWYRSKKYPVQ